MLAGVNLQCIRGDRVLFRRLHCTADAGAALQICGVNGAGKTSLLRILCGLREPQSGAVLWRGTPILHQRAEYCGQLAYLGHDGAILGELNARENVTAARALLGNSTEISITDALRRLQITTPRACRFLSAGQRQRVALARIWLQRGGLWILDEPATALDATAMHTLEAMVDAHTDAGGITIFTSHRALNLRAPVQRLQLQDFAKSR